MDAYLTRSELGEWIKTPVPTLETWAYKGLGPPFCRVGRKVLYARSDVEKWLEEQRVQPSDKRAEAVGGG